MLANDLNGHAVYIPNNKRRNTKSSPGRTKRYNKKRRHDGWMSSSKIRLSPRKARGCALELRFVIRRGRRCAAR
ncbi:hypothetical protein L596_009719 [Steinernema carpocapsae]|uniref:Uncharacterized protein n=1 Tax=Steinernema carpocapsae TaxID=34508 RepID=A0A4U5PG55_STECR|nr:hypothetical protein L596_009719 [Steinernema carpocapsae]